MKKVIYLLMLTLFILSTLTTNVVAEPTDDYIGSINSDEKIEVPIDSSLALCTDTGSMELFVGDYFENAADVIEVKTK